jgi:glycerol kinase
MRSERRARPRAITAGGGAAASRSLLQCQADLFQQEIGRSSILETTSRGAAFLAGLEYGFWRSPESLARSSRPSDFFRPRLSARQVWEKSERWKTALELAARWTSPASS